MAFKMKSPFNKVNDPPVIREELDDEGKAIWDWHRIKNSPRFYGLSDEEIKKIKAKEEARKNKKKK